MGYFYISTEGTARAGPCDQGGSYLPTREYTLPGFYLDADEITNACYQGCVDAGACVSIPLGPADHPATLTHDTAAAFCEWMHGRIPSYAELSRAAVGDLESPAEPALILRWMQCTKEQFASAACQRFRLRNPPSEVPVEPVRSYPDDLGPFGHHDLFGSQAELTDTKPYSAEEVGSLLPIECAAPVSARAPASFGSGARVLYEPALDVGTDFAHLPFLVPPSDEFVLGIRTEAEPGGEGTDLYGARCAYDRHGEEP